MSFNQPTSLASKSGSDLKSPSSPVPHKSHLTRFRRNDENSSVHQKEEDDIQNIHLLEKKVKRNFVSRFAKSLKTTLCAVVGTAVGVLFALSALWALSFFSQTTTFGVDLVKQTFDSLEKQISSLNALVAVSTIAFTADRSLLPTNVTYPQLYTKVTDVFLTGMALYEKLSVTISTDELESGLLMSNPYIISFGAKETGFMEIMSLNMATFQPGSTLSKTPYRVGADPAALAMAKTYPQHFKEIRAVGCDVTARECTAVVLSIQASRMSMTGTILHSLQFDYGIDHLSSTLQMLTHKSGFSFVLQRHDQRLVAISSLQELLQEDSKKYSMIDFSEGNEEFKLMKADEYPHERISSITKHLKSLYGYDLSAISSVNNRAGIRMYEGPDIIDVKSIPLLGVPKNYPGILDEFLIVHVIDSRVFTNTALTWTYILSSLTFVIGVTSLSMVGFLSCCISRPINQLLKQMEAAKMLQLDEINTKRFSYFSELRRMQGSFYFLVHSMKQYRSFLPAHVLQTIEAQLKVEKMTSKKKSSKKICPTQENIDTSSVVSADLRSETSGLSKVTHSIVEDYSPSNFMMHQFQVGTMRRFITVLKVHIVDLENILQTSCLEDYTSMHATIVETIEMVVNITTGATFNSFTQDSFLISLNSTVSCREGCERKGAALALKLKERLSKSMSRFSRDGFPEMPLLITVSSGTALVSLLGSSSMKQQSIHGLPVLLCDAMRVSTVTALLSLEERSSLFSNGNIVVLIDHFTEEKLSKQNLQVNQVNQLMANFDNVVNRVRVSELLALTNNQDENQEWLYEYKQDEDLKDCKEMQDKMNSAWRLLMRKNAKDCIENVEAILEKKKGSGLFESLLLKVAQRVNEEYDGDVYQYLAGDSGERATPWHHTGGLEWRSVLQKEDTSPE